MGKKHPAPKLSSEQDFSDLLRSFFEQQLSQLQTERGRIVVSEDPEGVHQMRIAIRRTRSILLSLGHKHGALYERAKWLARELGRVRDLDVLLASQPRRSAYGGHLHRRWRAERQALKDHLHSERFDLFVVDFRAFIDAIGARNQTIRQAGKHYIGRQLRKTKRLGRQIDAASSDALLHALRIQCKHLRYLIEMFETAAPASLGAFSANARALQNLLGALNDERIALASLAHYADRVDLTEENRAALIAAGKQIRDREMTAQALRADFPAAWAKFDRRCTRKKLRRALNGK